MDSVSPETLAFFKAQADVEVRQLPVEKDETDLEAALSAALDLGATSIGIAGGLGGRLDHSLGNIYLLAAPWLLKAGTSVHLSGEREGVWLIKGGQRLLLEGQPGDLLSLIPLTGEATGVLTENLYYPLVGETLYRGPTRGVSNVFTTHQAAVSLKEGLLLAIHSFKN